MELGAEFKVKEGSAGHETIFLKALNKDVF